MGTSLHFWVYILASRIGGTLYIGVTNDLIRRVFEHRERQAEGFTRKYGVHRLVYFEQFDDIENAIRREKRLKSWNRAWKIRLIEESNPHWIDLYYQNAGQERVDIPHNYVCVWDQRLDTPPSRGMTAEGWAGYSAFLIPPPPSASSPRA